MQIAAFEVREDEKVYFDQYGKQYRCRIDCSGSILDAETAGKLNGYDGVTTLGQSSINRTVLEALKDAGVRYYVTRTIGMNHIDLKAAGELGIAVSNTAYPPSGVADYTIMLMLMTLRNFKQALWRINVNDYSLGGLRGRELGQMTVGVAGTGKIGAKVIEYLSGFGCRILAYDKFQKKEVAGKASYVSFQELLEQSDIITLHLPLLEDTYHIIDQAAVERMKDQVILINCARGELADTDALIRGIECRKIGGLGLDVFEGEGGIYHQDKRSDIICNPKMAYLRQFPNVIMTQHLAFYTDVAVESMVKEAVAGMCRMEQEKTLLRKEKEERK